MTTINPRNRNLTQVSASATQPARLPNPILPRTGDTAVDNWMAAMQEWREVREGQRGNPFEKVLTGRDLVGMGVVESRQITNPGTPPAPTAPGVVVSTGSGNRVVGFEEFSQSIKATRLYTSLIQKIDDPSRFNDLHERTKQALLEELAPLDGKITSEIRRVDEQFSSAQESFAQEVVTIRASVARAAAGVRSVRFASANENRATAGLVTTVTARLDNFTGGAPGTATVESKMTAIASRATGLEAQYTVKVTAGGAIAGFGLGATAPVGGTPSSAFIIQADKFAIVDSSYVGGLTNTPPAGSVMFGVDSDGAYVGGNLKVGGLAYIDGNQTVGGYNNALTVNNSLARTVGVYTKSSVLDGFGLVSIATGGGSGAGISGIGTSGSAGVRATGVAGSVALAVVGPMTIDNKTQVANLNADYLGGRQFGYVGTGASVATFSGVKPGASSTNTWIEVLDTSGAVVGYFPLWQT